MINSFGSGLDGIQTYSKFQTGQLKQLEAISREMLAAKDDPAKQLELSARATTVQTMLEYGKGVADLLVKLVNITNV